jgi:acetolactate synthase small subunit
LRRTLVLQQIIEQKRNLNMSTDKTNERASSHSHIVVGAVGGRKEYTITVYTENQIGLLNRIAIIFSRRKINIESLNTSPSEVESVHRFTILINETEDVVRKLCRQIEKQVEVLKAYYNTEDEIVWQELALYKVPDRGDY